VGFGDYFPRTTGGRVVMLFCCMYGTVVLSLVVVLLTDKMDMDSHETRASIVLDKLEVHKKMKQSAAYIIGGVGKMRKINSMKKSAKKALLKRFAYHVHRFKSLREEKRCISENDFREEMEREFDLAMR
jgi:hypothetical protein